MEVLKYLVSVVIGGGGFAFIQFLIERSDKHKNNKDVKLTRLELMMLMSDYPQKANEIMNLAYEYFVIRKGNSYMHELFEDYLNKMKIAKPEWYK